MCFFLGKAPLPAASARKSRGVGMSGVNDRPDSDADCRLPGEPSPYSEPVGKICSVTGSVGVIRQNDMTVQVVVGDFVYRDDIIATGVDGSVGLVFQDGTTTTLSPGTRLVIAEFISDDSTLAANSVLFDLRCGSFSFVPGRVATTGRFVIDTPFATIRGNAQRGGVASLTLAAFTFALVEKILAAPEDITFLQYDTLTYKDFQHGKFEISTKEVVPRVFMVDDPAVTVELNRTSSGINFQQLPNTPAQMANLLAASQSAATTYSVGLQDPFIRQQQRADVQQPTDTVTGSIRTATATATAASGSGGLAPEQTPSAIHVSNLQTQSTTTTETLNVTLASTTPSPITTALVPPVIDKFVPPFISQVLSLAISGISPDAGGITISGTIDVADASRLISVKDTTTNTTLGATTANASGNWSLSGITLAAGSHSLTALATDAAGNLNTSAAFTATIDLTGPSITIDAIATDKIVNASEAAAGFAISGSSSGVENGQTVTVKIVNGSNVTVDTYTTTVATNAWSVSVTPAQALALANGSYTVKADVTNAAGNPASEATQAITVTAANDAPETNAGAGSAAEDAASIAVSLSGSDIDGTVASFHITSLPLNGTLYSDAGLTTVVASGGSVTASGNAATVYFVPAANFNGQNTFQYAAVDNNGLEDATPATATITVTAANDAPETNAGAGSAAEDAASIAVSLSGSDIDGTVASFHITSLPLNGTLYSDAGLTTVVASGGSVTASGNAATVYFVPAANFNGQNTFQYAAVDNNGLEDATPATATITVTAVNDPPQTNAGAGSGLEDATSIAVSLSGSDIDGTVASFHITSLPLNGTLYSDAGLTTVVASGGSVTASGNAATVYFVPAANFNGQNTFQYAAVDNNGLEDATPATATITVTAVNDPPQTNAGAGSGLEDATSIAVSLSGSDIDGTVASFHITSLPLNGTLYSDAGLTTVVASGGSVTASGNAATVYFVPAANFNGQNTFQYAAVDNNGLEDATPATATITVTAVNDPPQTNAGAGSGLEDATSIAVSLSGSDIDGTVASFHITSLPLNGTLYSDAGLTTVVASGGSVTASGNAATVYFVPAANFNGQNTFQYAAVDNNGLEDATPATATITVTAVNDPPQTNAGAGSGLEDATSIAVSLSGSDIDGTVASFHITSLPLNGTLYSDAGLTTVVASGGSVTASGNAATVYFVPAANFNGQNTFQYAAVDNNGLEDATPATATITVTAVIDIAPQTNAGAGSGLEDATSIAVSLSGSDIDGTVASFHITSLPLNGTLYSDAGLTTVVASGGSVTASGNAATVYFVPAANFNGQNTFQYAAVDNNGLEDATPATATITVTAVNDPPQTNAGAGSGLEDATSIAVSLSGSDIDGTVASFHITSLPLNGTLYSDAGLTTVVASGGSVTASGNAATVYFVPAANFNGQNTFQYAAVDNNGLEDATPATATITVTAVNDPPQTNAGAGSAAEDAASIAVSLSGSDIDGTVASFHITSLPLNGTLYSDAGLTTVVASGGSVTASGNAATVYFVPAANFNGQNTFQYAAVDNNGLEDATPATATITVTAVNDPPQTNAGAGSGLEDATSIAVSLSGSDIDGTVASFHITSLPLNGTLYSDAGLTTVVASGGSVTASGNAATVYFVPAANFNGQNTFQYAAVDNNGLEDATPATATITVTAVNDPPQTNAGAGSGLEDATSIAVSLSGSDIDGTVASFHITSLPLNGTLYSDAGLTTVVASGGSVTASGNAATVYFVPAANFNGQNTFQYAAVDNNGLEDATPATATITVTAVNDPPQTNAGAGSGLEDATSIAVSLSGSDIDGTVASFHITSLPLNGTLYSDAGLTTVVASGGSVTASGNAATVYFVPAANFNGQNTFQYAAVDNNGLEDATPATATITVTAVIDKRRRPMRGRAAGWRTRPRLRCRCRAPTSTAPWRRSTSPACR